MDLKKKRNIFHLIEWIVAVVTAAVIAGIWCMPNRFENQFLDATVFGYLIVSSLVFLALCFSEDLPEKTQYAICGTGFVLYLVAALLLFLHGYGSDDGDDRDYHDDGDSGGIRVLIAAIGCTCNAVVYGVEFFWSLIKKGAID